MDTAWEIIRVKVSSYPSWVPSAQEDPGASAWLDGGKGPIDYLNALDIAKAASSSADADGPATSYAQTILAYVAAGQSSALSSAGSEGIDLESSLLAFQAGDGHFSARTSAASDGSAGATAGDAMAASTSTTAWSVLALVALNDPANKKALSAAVSWLQGEQGGDGGFAATPGDSSTVPDTALAVVTLRAGGLSAGSAVVTNALTYLRGEQLPDGGFPVTLADGSSDAAATAWAIQAIGAVGEDPVGLAWQQSGGTPCSCLAGLQVASGAFDEQTGVLATSPLTAPAAVIALAGRTLPVTLADSPVVVAFKPRIGTLTPAAGASFAAHSVTVKATYSDAAGGTGIDAAAVRLLVDGNDVTPFARVGSASLSFRATGLAYGRHAVRLTVADKAGNLATARHTFTLAAAGSAGGSQSAASGDSGSAGGSDSSGAGSGDSGGSSSSSSSGDTSSSAGTPSGAPGGAAASPAPSPSASETAGGTGSPSSAPSSPPAGEERSGRGAASRGVIPHVPGGGYVGGALMTLFPVGALVSHMVYRRRMDAVTTLAHAETPPMPKGTAAARLGRLFSVSRWRRFARRQVNRWWAR